MCGHPPNIAARIFDTAIPLTGRQCHHRKNGNPAGAERTLTTQNRGSKYEVELPRLPFLREVSVANVQGIASLTASRLERKIGEAPADVLQRIRDALAFATGAA